MILDRVVSSASQILCDVCPLVAELLVQLQKHAVLVDRPRILPYVMIEVVVPAFAALFASPAWKMLGDKSPRACAVKVYKLSDCVVFLLCPLLPLRAG